MTDTHIIEQEARAVVAQTPSESAQIIGMIGQLASDPDSDIDKMERLMAMQERLVMREAELAFNDALAIMQPLIPVIEERGKIEFKGKVQSTYALWEDVNAAIKPVLSAHGFSLTFKTATKPEIQITGTLRHRLGHKESSEFIGNADSSGSKNSIQAVKSTISYGKRIVADALLNITSHGEDDDAFSTSEADFDTSPFTEAIRAAKSMDTLNKVAADMKAQDVPSGALTMLRTAWAGRAAQIQKELKDAA